MTDLAEALAWVAAAVLALAAVALRGRRNRRRHTPMATREHFAPGDPRAPAVTPKSEEERRRDEVSVADLVAGYPGVPAPVRLHPLQADEPGFEDVHVDWVF